MAQAVQQDRGARSVSFEVERFERRGRDQVVLSGRWFGLRGRRFIRPTLMLATTDSGRREALADLDHKPWSAEDGELWEASFSLDLDGGDLGPIELTVAPDVTVGLPAPGPSAAERRIAARPRRDDLLDNLRGARRDGRTPSESGNGSEPRRARRPSARREDGLEAQREAPRAPQPPSQTNDSAALIQRLTSAEQEAERLRTELERYETARVQAASALTRRDAAVSRLTEAVAARDGALRDRDGMAAERDQALRDRDRAIAKADKLADAVTTRADRRADPAAVHSRAVTRGQAAWAQRVLAVSVLVVAVLALAITARLL